MSADTTILVGIALGSSSASAAFLVPGKGSQPITISRWPGAEDSQSAVVPLQVKPNLASGITWGYHVKPEDEAERLIRFKFGNILLDELEPAIMKTLYELWGSRSTTCGLPADCIILLMEFLKVVKSHVAGVLNRTFYVAPSVNGATNSYKMRLCFSVPNWWGNKKKKIFLDMLRQNDHEPCQIVSEAEAALTFYLSKAKRCRVGQGDVLILCNMEELITSICLYEVEEELVYRKREVIIPSGSSLISKAFERYVEDILEGDLNNLDLSAGEVLKGLGKIRSDFERFMSKWDGTKTYNFRLPWSIKDDLSRGIQGQYLSIRSDVIEQAIFHHVLQIKSELEIFIDIAAKESGNSTKVYALCIGALSECPYWMGILKKHFESSNAEFLHCTDGKTAVSRGAALILDTDRKKNQLQEKNWHYNPQADEQVLPVQPGNHLQDWFQKINNRLSERKVLFSSGQAFLSKKHPDYITLRRAYSRLLEAMLQQNGLNAQAFSVLQSLIEIHSGKEVYDHFNLFESLRKREVQLAASQANLARLQHLEQLKLPLGVQLDVPELIRPRNANFAKQIQESECILGAEVATIMPTSLKESDQEAAKLLGIEKQRAPAEAVTELSMTDSALNDMVTGFCEITGKRQEEAVQYLRHTNNNYKKAVECCIREPNRFLDLFTWRQISSSDETSLTQSLTQTGLHTATELEAETVYETSVSQVQFGEISRLQGSMNTPEEHNAYEGLLPYHGVLMCLELGVTSSQIAYSATPDGYSFFIRSWPGKETTITVPSSISYGPSINSSIQWGHQVTPDQSPTRHTWTKLDLENFGLYESRPHGYEARAASEVLTDYICELRKHTFKELAKKFNGLLETITMTKVLVLLVHREWSEKAKELALRAVLAGFDADRLFIADSAEATAFYCTEKGSISVDHQTLVLCNLGKSSTTVTIVEVLQESPNKRFKEISSSKQACGPEIVEQEILNWVRDLLGHTAWSKIPPKNSEIRCAVELIVKNFDVEEDVYGWIPLPLECGVIDDEEKGIECLELTVTAKNVKHFFEDWICKTLKFLDEQILKDQRSRTNSASNRPAVLLCGPSTRLDYLSSSIKDYCTSKGLAFILTDDPGTEAVRGAVLRGMKDPHGIRRVPFARRHYGLLPPEALSNLRRKEAIKWIVRRGELLSPITRLVLCSFKPQGPEDQTCLIILICCGKEDAPDFYSHRDEDVYEVARLSLNFTKLSQKNTAGSKIEFELIIHFSNPIRISLTKDGNEYGDPVVEVDWSGVN